MCKTFYVIGLTCSGKDWMIEKAVEMFPNLFGAVQVGKEMRKRHPPEYFQGSGAPEHTQTEAFSIFKEQWEACKKAGVKYILVSGQPRRVSQVSECLNHAWGTVIWIHTPEETIKERMTKRFENDPSALELAQQRLINDKLMYYDVLFEILEFGAPMRTLYTKYDDVTRSIQKIAHFGDL